MPLSYTENLYTQREKEIELCFKEIQKISESAIDKNNDFFKITKSAFLIMLYNMIESCFYSMMNEIHEQISRVEFSQIKKEIQGILIENMIKNYKNDVLQEKYENLKNITLSFIKLIENKESIKSNTFNKKIGNLDNRRIKKICDDYGIRYNIPKQCKQDYLERIRTERDKLAHGETSFVECSQEITINDLKEMKIASLKFIRCILNGGINFISNEDYKKDIIKI